ncbi:hypothetical protein BDZ85DRAFT_55488 [Elsinoe ampelina]|uniref:Uncharacterized protein n=1 Tax=Elsinoe ampelina TaxID=302913 RepID=A0A6A6GNC7_9PEZI|nr:hypothetical protein BDZ85DRAFT_55488 [Elsinoe ampelina]
MSGAKDNTSHGLAFLTNFTASLVLAALLGLAVWVHKVRFVIAPESTHGYQAIDLDTSTWNVACTIVGTAVGLFTTVAFSMQDDIITRRELASDRGVRAIFLRPLTLRRGAEQIWHAQLAIGRSTLVFLTLASALTTAATVALFGIRGSTEVGVNSYPSFPLAALNMTWTERLGDAVLAMTPPLQRPTSNHLTSLLYRSALVAGLKARNAYGPRKIYEPYLPESGTIGDTLYETLSTGGVGLNTSSYLQYWNDPDGFDMPNRFEFNGIAGRVFGTHINVTCTNVSAEYTWSEDRLSSYPDADMRVLSFSKPGGLNITMFRPPEWSRGQLQYLALASYVSAPQTNSDPIHTIAMAGVFRTGFVWECRYSGREYLAQVSMSSPVSPLIIERDAQQGPLIGPIVKQRVANATHDIIRAGQGGNLAKAWMDAEFNYDGLNSTNATGPLETIMGQVSEGYISLVRQSIERTTINDPSSLGDLGAEVRVYMTVTRMGGSHIAWTAVFGILLLGTLSGTVRACVGRRAVSFEAQDAVRLLSATNLFQGLKDTSIVAYRDGIELLDSPGSQSPPYGEVSATPKHVGT